MIWFFQHTCLYKISQATTSEYLEKATDLGKDTEKNKLLNLRFTVASSGYSLLA